MSGILKRRVYYERDDRPGFNCFRFSDWNMVITSLGPMMEPSQMVPTRDAGQAIDWLEEGIRIDALKNMPSDQPKDLIGGEIWLTGYHLHPRSGR